jgi:hypothetical protein
MYSTQNIKRKDARHCSEAHQLCTRPLHRASSPTAVMFDIFAKRAQFDPRQPTTCGPHDLNLLLLVTHTCASTCGPTPLPTQPLHRKHEVATCERIKNSEHVHLYALSDTIETKPIVLQKVRAHTPRRAHSPNMQLRAHTRTR